jgi:hypothetical protein
MGDIAWKRKLLSDFRARNERHKMAAFELEKQEAKRENRPPRIWSPEQVPDLELPAELRPPVKEPREPWRFEGFGPNDVKIFKMIGIAILLYLPFGITLQIVGNMPGSLASRSWLRSFSPRCGWFCATRPRATLKSSPRPRSGTR